MRVVRIKIEIQDIDTLETVNSEMSLNQFNTLTNLTINGVNELIPQLNKELTEKVGFHEEISEKN
jgi:hypothetical protein